MIKIHSYIFICTLMGISQFISETQANEFIEILQIIKNIKQVPSDQLEEELISTLNKFFENCITNNNPACNSQLRPDLERKLVLFGILSNDPRKLVKLAKMNEEKSVSNSKTPPVRVSRKRRALLALLGQLLGPLAGLVTESQAAEFITEISKLNEGQNGITTKMLLDQTGIKTQMDKVETKVERQSDQMLDIREKVMEIANRVNNLAMYEKLFEQVKNLSEGSHKLEEKLDNFIDATKSVINSLKPVKDGNPDSSNKEGNPDAKDKKPSTSS